MTGVCPEFEGEEVFLPENHATDRSAKSQDQLVENVLAAQAAYRRCTAENKADLGRQLDDALCELLNSSRLYKNRAGSRGTGTSDI